MMQKLRLFRKQSIASLVVLFIPFLSLLSLLIIQPGFEEFYKKAHEYTNNSMDIVFAVLFAAFTSLFLFIIAVVTLVKMNKFIKEFKEGRELNSIYTAW
ncbi:Uncharacterised protein, partial [Mycoplasmopsis edwardii]